MAYKSNALQNRIDYHKKQSDIKFSRYSREQNLYDLHSAIYHESVYKEMKKKHCFLTKSEISKIFNDSNIVFY